MTETSGPYYVDRVAGSYFRKGKCVVCGKHCERSRTIDADTFEAMQRKAAARESRPLMHKRCERNYLGEELPW